MLSIKNAFEMLKTGSASSRWLKPLKMLKTRIALGVDISDKLISLALLKRTKNGVKLLASANAPVPDGAIINGNIANADTLAKAIRSLKNNSRIRATRAAVSLFTEPAIVQIMGIPKQVPANIRQFVQDQVKHIAVLPTNNIALDFCSVAGAGLETSYASRLLVAAADDRKVNEIVKMCNQADLTVEAIEPPPLAYTRALYAEKVARKFNCNILIAILKDSTLTLCVFKKQAIDFIRTKSIDKTPGTPYGGKTQPDELAQWLAEQINTVIQFYDVEVSDSSGKWDITVVADCVQLPENAEGILKAKVADVTIQVLTSEAICRAAVGQYRGPDKVEVSPHDRLADCRQTDRPSPVAIGLAMKLLDMDARNVGVNLLPPEVVRLRTAKEETLITANILAAVLLFMILAVIVPNWKIKKLNKSINYKKVNLLQNARTLFGKRIAVNQQIDAVNNQINKINTILESHPDTDWSGLLSDIAKAIPRTVCMTNFSSSANSGALLKGLATSNEAVYWFVDRLNKSKHINLASITEAKRDSRGLVSYEIRCNLAPGKGK